MTQWTKVAVRGRREPRASPAVSRNRTGARVATMILPGSMGPFPNRADLYSDGNGKLAFALGDEGAASVRMSGRTARITIPAQFADRIPYGTKDVSLVRDGDMFVLNLNALGGA